LFCEDEQKQTTVKNYFEWIFLHCLRVRYWRYRGGFAVIFSWQECCTVYVNI